MMFNVNAASYRLYRTGRHFVGKLARLATVAKGGVAITALGKGQSDTFTRFNTLYRSAEPFHGIFFYRVFLCNSFNSNITSFNHELCNS